MSKKIFIDCGANLGQSIDNFIKHWPDWQDYTILSFEANPNLASEFDRFKTIENIKFENSAVWIYDGVLDFYLASNGNAGSSIIKNKITGCLDTSPTQVKCVDLDRIIRQFSINDYIILKIDVEGAEYELLDYLLHKNTFEFINQLFIEFHTKKVHKTIQDNEMLLSRLKEYSNLQTHYDTYNHYNFL